MAFNERSFRRYIFKAANVRAVCNVEINILSKEKKDEEDSFTHIGFNFSD